MISTTGQGSTIITVREVAALCQCSTDMVLRAISARHLIAFRVGIGVKRGPWRIRRESAWEYISKREQSA